MTIEAIAAIGPWTGLRIYDRCNTSEPVVLIEMTARHEIIGIARDALGADYMDFVKGGKTYRIPAGVPLATQILDALRSRG